MASNPFLEPLQQLRQIGLTNAPSWIYTCLAILITTKLLMILSCIIIICIPIYRGKASRKKHLWLFRRHYPDTAGSMPYLVPNRSMLVAVCELLSGILYFMVGLHSSLSFMFPESFKHSTNAVWYGTAILPSYIGIWLAGWGLLYVCFGPYKNSTAARARFLTPSIYNTSWLCGAIVVISITLFWAITVHFDGQRLYKGRDELFELLDQAAQNFSNPLYAGQIPVPNISQKAKVFATTAIKAIRHLQAWAAFWVALDLGLVAFYLFILQHLLRMIRKLLRQCEAQEFLFVNGPTATSVNNNAQNVTTKSSTALAELRKELRFLSLYNCSIVAALLCEVAGAFCQYFIARNVDKKKYLPYSPIVCMLPSTFLSPALLYQCWRVLTERSPPEEDKVADHISTSPPTQLPVFQEQLLKWYDGPRLDEADCLQLHLDNFTGVVERSRNSDVNEPRNSDESWGDERESNKWALDVIGSNKNNV